MLIVKEMLYFIFALFLLTVLLCLLIGSGWVLNTLCKELLDMDIVSIMKTMKGKKNDKSK